MPTRLAIVVVPDFGERLIPLAAEMPVWVADTPANRATIEGAWPGTSDAAPGGGVTVFRVGLEGTPDDWAANVIGAVVEHHGTFSQAPPVDTLELHGVVVTDALRAELAAHGFTDVTGDREVMTARLTPAA